MKKYAVKSINGVGADETGNVPLPATGAAFLVKTKAEIDIMISSSSLLAGATYKITGVDPTLYDDGTFAEVGVANSIEINVGGSGYTNGIYLNVPVLGGNGTDLVADFTVSAGNVVSISVPTRTSKNYVDGDLLSVDNSQLGGTGSGFVGKLESANLMNLPYNTPVFLQALTNNTLSPNGYGEFWNPKYPVIDGNGIYNGEWKMISAELESVKSVVNLGDTQSTPSGVVVDSKGNAWITNKNQPSLTKITPLGVSSNMVLPNDTPNNLIIDGADNIYIANGGGNNVLKVTPAGVITVHGTTGSYPVDLAMNSTGDIYTVNYLSSNVTKITPLGVSITIPTGGNPTSITIDVNDNVYLSLQSNSNLVKITPAGVVTTHAALTNTFSGLDTDTYGNVYVLSDFHKKIYKVTPSGVITEFGNTGVSPSSIFISRDIDDSVYVVQRGALDNVVWKYTSDGQFTKSPPLYSTAPEALCVTYEGVIFVANRDSNNLTRIIQTTVSFSGDETVTANNDATGVIRGDTSLLKETSGDWTTATTYVGDYTGAWAIYGGVQGFTNFTIGSETIWGGYVWENVSGNIGSFIDEFDLTADWSKKAYNTTDYVKVYDKITCDYANGVILSREDIFLNKVSSTRAYIVLGKNSIRSFMFGNPRVSKNIVTESNVDNINFRGNAFHNNTIQNGSVNSNKFEVRSEFIQNIFVNSQMTSNEIFGHIQECELFSSVIGTNYVSAYSFLHLMNLRGSYLQNLQLRHSSSIQYSELSQGCIINGIIMIKSYFCVRLSDDSNLEIGSCVDSVISKSTFTKQARLVTTENMINKTLKDVDFVGNGSNYAYFVGLNYSTHVFGNGALKTVYNSPTAGTTKLKFYNEDDMLVVVDVVDQV